MVAADVSVPYRGRQLTFQMKAHNGTGSHTLRMAVLSHGNGASPDQIAATFISAYNANSTDPTWGTNLTAITPDSANANCSIVGAGLTCVLGANWLTFSGKFTVPADCNNLIAVVFTDSQIAGAGTFALSEMGLHEGDETSAFTLRPAEVEFNALCAYYWKSFRPPTAPASNIGSHTNGSLHYFNNLVGAVAGDTPTFPFPVPMRYKAPTGLLYNPHGSGAHVRNVTANSDSSGETIHCDNIHSFYISLTGSFAWLMGDDIWFHVAFEAEL